MRTSDPRLPKLLVPLPSILSPSEVNLLLTFTLGLRLQKYVRAVS